MRGQGLGGALARAEGLDEAAASGSVAWVPSAPEAVGLAGVGPQQDPVVSVCWDVEAVGAPLCAAPSWSLEKALGAGAPPGAGTAAAGPEYRAPSAPRPPRWAPCNSPGSSLGFSLDPISWGQSAPHPGCHVRVVRQHLTPDLCLQ